MKAVAAAALALLALGGTFGPALAEVDAGIATPAPQAAEVAADLPRFVPSAEPEAEFADAFAPFDDPSVTAPPPSEVVDDIPDGVASWYGPGFAGRRTADRPAPRRQRPRRAGAARELVLAKPAAGA